MDKSQFSLKEKSQNHPFWTDFQKLGFKNLATGGTGYLWVVLTFLNTVSKLIRN
ncbi:hypothetical protein STRCR_1904 [Streptococcus criceti HS-6]|uniref:Uncharacterized protein n=1 Tax=Streptococcus criceti HS-6 TaxID=873449 RepID=G5JR20_STRCG|nr:hypothetical protein STRCR_1904 [Streptococcus criceti HS-6]